MQEKGLIYQLTVSQAWKIPGPDREQRELQATLTTGELLRGAMIMGAFGLKNLGRILLVSVVTAMWNAYILSEEVEFLRRLLGKWAAQSVKKNQMPFSKRVNHCYTWLSQKFPVSYFSDIHSVVHIVAQTCWLQELSFQFKVHRAFFLIVLCSFVFLVQW